MCAKICSFRLSLLKAYKVKLTSELAFLIVSDRHVQVIGEKYQFSCLHEAIIFLQSHCFLSYLNEVLPYANEIP